MVGDVGVPVRATATGKVTIAGRIGGYGNMVEITPAGAQAAVKAVDVTATGAGGTVDSPPCQTPATLRAAQARLLAFRSSSMP